MALSKRELNSVVNLLLLPTAVWVAAAGIISELWDINDFVYHKYPAFLLAALVAAHVYLKLPQWWASVRVLFKFFACPFTSFRALAQNEDPKGLGDPLGLTRRAVETPARKESRIRLTRRDALGLMLGGVGGFLLGNFFASARRLPLPFGEDINDVYHQWSKPGYASLLLTALNWGTQPAPFKDYAHAEKITLAPAPRRDGMSLEDAIARRRSVRDYADGALTLEELTRLLYYSVGINDTRWGVGLRAAPSAGAQYPIETYVVAHAISGLPSGLYHYNVRDHLLEHVRGGDFRQAIMDSGLGQEFLAKANVVLALTAIFQRTRWRYQERTYRYVLLEAGHIAQNVYLMGTALGLGVCAVGAFWDDAVNRLLEVDGKEEAAIYLLAVGRV